MDQQLQELLDPTPFYVLTLSVFVALLAVGTALRWLHQRKHKASTILLLVGAWGGLSAVFTYQMMSVHPPITSLAISAGGVAAGLSVFGAMLPWNRPEGGRGTIGRVVASSAIATGVIPAFMFFLAALTGVDYF